MQKTSPYSHPHNARIPGAKRLMISGAQDATLSIKNGDKLIDACSSGGIITHGHANPKIVKAIEGCIKEMGHLPYGTLTNEPVERFAKALAGFSPSALDYVFLSETGDSAISKAIHMAKSFHAAKGQKREKIAVLESSCPLPCFDGHQDSIVELPFPDKNQGKNTVTAFTNMAKKPPCNIAALILEPMVQSGSGMRMYDADTLKAIYKVCQDHNILFIADERFTGFGRTGVRFACQNTTVTPDIMCLSSEMTGGFLPLGAVITTKEVHKVLHQNNKTYNTHGTESMLANTLACSAALANIDLWSITPMQKMIDEITLSHLQAAKWFEARPDVKEIRTLGTIFAVEIKTEAYSNKHQLIQQLSEFYLDLGAYIIPYENTVAIAPPYCITHEQLENIYDTLWRSLDAIRDNNIRIAA